MLSETLYKMTAENVSILFLCVYVSCSRVSSVCSQIISHLLTSSKFHCLIENKSKSSLGSIFGSTIRRTVNKDVEHLNRNANLTGRKLKLPSYILILNYTGLGIFLSVVLLAHPSSSFSIVIIIIKVKLILGVVLPVRDLISRCLLIFLSIRSNTFKRFS